ncbi:MAG: heavy-metal-associated domain-containing protein [Ruminococcaceae bacterium]|nr:heavy-metal-associated domain-containing protein [Oscillospiraceae bacterium]
MRQRRIQTQTKKRSALVCVKTFSVGGMHCKRCTERVEETVNGIRGIAGSVDWKKGVLTVAYAEEVDDAVIGEHLEKAGYSLTPLEP